MNVSIVPDVVKSKIPEVGQCFTVEDDYRVFIRIEDERGDKATFYSRKDDLNDPRSCIYGVNLENGLVNFFPIDREKFSKKPLVILETAEPIKFKRV